MAAARAVRIEIPAAAARSKRRNFLEGLGGLEFSSRLRPAAALSVWVDSDDLRRGAGRISPRSALAAFPPSKKNPPTGWPSRPPFGKPFSWTAISSTPTTPISRRRRRPAFAASSFRRSARSGPGSHESTRLAVRLLLAEDLRGRARPRRRLRNRDARVRRRARRRSATSWRSTSTAMPPSRRASRRARTAIPRVAAFAGPLEALRDGARFDVIVANMIHEEIAPLLPALRAHLAPGGRLLCSGQLAEREGEWEDLLRKERLSAGSLASGERVARDRVGFFE